MVEIPQELKDKMKEQRLNQLHQQLFSLKMDLASFEAIGERAKTEIERTKQAIEDGEKAYAAVGAM